MIISLALSTALVIGVSGQIETVTVVNGTMTNEACEKWRAFNEENVPPATTNRVTDRPQLAIYYQCAAVPMSDFERWGGETYEQIEEKTLPR